MSEKCTTKSTYKSLQYVGRYMFRFPFSILFTYTSYRYIHMCVLTWFMSIICCMSSFLWGFLAEIKRLRDPRTHHNIKENAKWDVAAVPFFLLMYVLWSFCVLTTREGPLCDQNLSPKTWSHNLLATYIQVNSAKFWKGFVNQKCKSKYPGPILQMQMSLALCGVILLF